MNKQFIHRINKDIKDMGYCGHGRGLAKKLKRKQAREKIRQLKMAHNQGKRIDRKAARA